MNDKKNVELLGFVQFDHICWLNELRHASKEIEIYQNRLLELVEDTAAPIEGRLMDIFDSLEKLKGIIETLEVDINLHKIKNRTLVQSNGHLKAMVNSVHSENKGEMKVLISKLNRLKDRFHKVTVLLRE